MPIVFRDVSASAGTSTPLPAVQAGDVLIAMFYRDNNGGGSTGPTAATQNWNLIGRTTGGSGAAPGLAAFWHVWQPGDVAPTFSNGTAIVLASYSGCDLNNPVGASVFSDQGTGTSVGIPAVTLTRTDGTSWVVAGYEHRQSSGLSVPAGMVERANAAHGNGNAGRFAYAGAPNVSTFDARTSAATASATWRAGVVELLAASAAPVNTGAGFLSLL